MVRKKAQLGDTNINANGFHRRYDGKQWRNKCMVDKCILIPRYNVKGERAIYCSQHYKKGMINILEKRKCLTCGKQPYFNKEGETKGLYCSEHKKPGMIDVIHPRCKDCSRRPRYNIEGSKIAIYCEEHKKPNMINTMSDKCKDCDKQPTYNIEGNVKPIYCKDHKKKGMVDIKNLRCKDCDSRPTYNIEGNTKPIYCKDHKKQGMVVIREDMCKSGVCTQRGNPKYDDHCTHCFANLFPKDPRTPLIKGNSKELKVVSYLLQKFPKMIHDKSLYVDLEGGCCASKRRIDLRQLVNETMICIEIDENEHKNYCKIDEKNRYDDLFMDFSGKYVFIRYNPDKYKVDGEYKNPSFEKRMEKLVKCIDKHMNRIKNNKNKELIEIRHLFYSK
jgi:uncharacterized protein YqkB